jgi:hypothetical protein
MIEALMTNHFIAAKISEYESLRTSLIKTIANYRVWLELPARIATLFKSYAYTTCLKCLDAIK